MSTTVPTSRPRLRGVFHGLGLLAAIVVGSIFVAAAPGGVHTVGAAAFAGAAVVMLGASTLYHRVTWSPSRRLWMRRVDHAGIYILIAGTYTPVGLISLHGTMQTVVLTVVWAGALAATLVKFLWVHAPKWLSAVFGLALGWAGIAAMPQLAHTAGGWCVALLGAGGLAYSAGAVVYALKRPNPWPGTLGYHEIFHLLTLVALACQYVAVAFFVVLGSDG